MSTEDIIQKCDTVLDGINQLKAELQSAEAKLAVMAAAVKANHEWHEDYDETGGYKGSDLYKTNTDAMTKLPERAQRLQEFLQKKDNEFKIHKRDVGRDNSCRCNDCIQWRAYQGDSDG